MEKARGLMADVIVFDLEDSVGPEKKPEARAMAVAMVKAGGYGSREIIVRVNGLATEWGEEDVKAVALSGADGICLPKIETADEVAAVSALLSASGSPLPIWVMIETPLGVENIRSIVSADPQVAVIVLGTTDLAKELRVPHTADRIGLQYSLGRCVHVARTYQKDILDGIYLDLEDELGFDQVCRQGKALGFDGKTLIHPKQLASANDVFGYGTDELARAKKIIAAWKIAEAEGKGVVVVDGKLVEGMHVDEAKRKLDIAAIIEKMVSESR
jgi:citrate lyase subunit beta/citryl-CoA lyase